MEWISSLKISRVWCWQDERWWTGVGWGSRRLVDRGRGGSKVGGEAWLVDRAFLEGGNSNQQFIVR